MIRDMTQGSVIKQLLRFSIPFMIANALQIAYNLVDMVIVGQYVGSAGLSAVAVGTDIMHLELLACMGFCSAGQVLISQSVGAGNREGIRHCIGTMFTMMTIAALVVTVLGLRWIDPLLNLLNVPAEAYTAAKIYSQVCFVGTIFTYGYNIVAAILRGMGDSKHPLIFVTIAALLNLALDMVLVAGLHWGTMGAALATVIGQGVSLITSLVYLYHRREGFGFDFQPKSFLIHGPTCKTLLKLGIPLALQSSAVSISQLFITSNINAYGVVVSAVNGVGAKLGQIAMVITNAIQMSGSSMIGQNFSARKKDRVSRIVWLSWGISLGFCTLLSVISGCFPEQIFGLFNREPEILAMSHEYVIILILNFIGFGLRAPMMALINGLGCAKFALVIGILDGIVARVGLAVLLGEAIGMGIMGYWLGSVVAGFVPFVVGGVFFWSGLWKRVKPMVSTSEE
jgi:putative MATE family efflux protein